MPTVNLDSQAQPLFSPGLSGSVLLVNNDTVKTIYVDQVPQVSPDSIPIPPQASMAVDTSQVWWGLNTSGGIVQLLVMPGGTQWFNPVGVQVAVDALGLATADNQATQISAAGTTNDTLISGIGLPVGAATEEGVAGVASGIGTSNGYLGGTESGALVGVSGNTIGKEMAAWVAGGDVSATPGGVPLLNLYTSLISETVTLPYDSGSYTTIGTATLTQPSIEGTVQLKNATAGTALACPTQVWFYWYDTNNELIACDSFSAYPTISTGDPHLIGFTGPSKGATVEVIAVNFNGTSGNDVTLTITLNQSSRVYSRFKVQSQSVGIAADSQVFPSGIASGTGWPNMDPTAGVLAEISVSIAEGDTETYFLPLYRGRAFISGSFAEASTDMQVYILNNTSLYANSNAFINLFANSSGAIEATEVALPGHQCLLSIRNTYSATETFDVTLIAADY
jgi:hypothetical protein